MYSRNRFGIVLVVAVLLFGVAPCSYAQEGEKEFKANCSTCHIQKSGHQMELMSASRPKLTSFPNCERLNRLSDKNIYDIIADGGASHGLSANMPAWSSSLSQSQIQELAKYMKSLCKNKTEP
jgi:mono/diheme cytochrome c family protein